MPKPTSLLKGFEKIVETARANPAKRQVIFDEATTGLALIVSPKGKKGFSIVARDPAGKQVWKSIGEVGKMTVADARAKARIGVDRIKAGEVEAFPDEKPVAAWPTVAGALEDALAEAGHDRERAARVVEELRPEYIWAWDGPQLEAGMDPDDALARVNLWVTAFCVRLLKVAATAKLDLADREIELLALRRGAAAGRVPG